MNPTMAESVIEQAYRDDATVAAAEYGAEFRRDIESYLPVEALEAVVAVGRRELSPVKSTGYAAFVDPSGGSQDAMTLAVAHRKSEKVILDLVREVRPPFSPETVVREFAAVLKSYRVYRVFGDRYAGESPREQFRKAGIDYRISRLAKSDLYRDLLPLVNSGRIELLDHARLIGQLSNLERRVGRSGKDSIDHGPGAHDDVANAAAGALLLAHRRRRRRRAFWGREYSRRQAVEVVERGVLIH